MFGDSNSSALQDQVLDLTDRIYNSWINWVNKYKIASTANSIIRGGELQTPRARLFKS